MDRINFIIYKGKRILIQDVSTMNPGRQFKETINQAQKMIASEPYNSVLSVFDATDCSFSDETISFMKKFVNSNTPYIKATTVVGINGLLQMALSSIAKSSGREFHTFKTREEALDFLAGIE